MLADSRFDIVGSAADLESLSGQFVDVERMLFLVEAATYAQEELLNALRSQNSPKSIPSSVIAAAKDRLALQGASRGSARRLTP